MKYSQILLATGLLTIVIALFGCSAPSAELLDSPIIGELERGMESGASTFDHSLYDELLQAHVDQDSGLVDYAGLKAEEEKLDSYLATLGEVDLTTIDGDEQLALLINAYNAYTLKLIIENYPGVASIRDLSDPWTTVRYHVGGYQLSLDQIEHNIIRPLYRDPRIHFAVNCAARDCPNLADFAFTGAEVDSQLDARTRAILTDSRFVRVENDRLLYTRVMHWYESDFTDPAFSGHARNVASYIAPYGTAEVRSFIESHDGDPPTSPLDYDWSLNDAN